MDSLEMEEWKKSKPKARMGKEQQKACKRTEPDAMANLKKVQKDVVQKRATVDAEKNPGTVKGKNELVEKKVSDNLEKDRFDSQPMTLSMETDHSRLRALFRASEHQDVGQHRVAKRRPCADSRTEAPRYRGYDARGSRRLQENEYNMIYDTRAIFIAR